jgi:RimJ/RimL family protein N-acetyltransferase
LTRLLSFARHRPIVDTRTFLEWSEAEWKCGFACEGTLRRYAEFPNLSPGEPLDVLCYSIVLG